MMSVRLLGLDGCKQNAWVMAESDSEFNWIRYSRVSDLKPLFDEAASGELVAVLDVPIGLTPEPRRVDLEARKVLGPKAGPAVFRPPVREALSANTHADANAINQKLARCGLPIMAFDIGPRIKFVDDLIRPEHQPAIREGHPEVSFVVLNNNRPLASQRRPHKGFGSGWSCSRQQACRPSMSRRNGNDWGKSESVRTICLMPQ